MPSKDQVKVNLITLSTGASSVAIIFTPVFADPDGIVGARSPRPHGAGKPHPYGKSAINPSRQILKIANLFLPAVARGDLEH